jgi:hypothetical protein
MIKDKPVTMGVWEILVQLENQKKIFPFPNIDALRSGWRTLATTLYEQVELKILEEFNE